MKIAMILVSDKLTGTVPTTVDIYPYLWKEMISFMRKLKKIRILFSHVRPQTQD